MPSSHNSQMCNDNGDIEDIEDITSVFSLDYDNYRLEKNSVVSRPRVRKQQVKVESSHNQEVETVGQTTNEDHTNFSGNTNNNTTSNSYLNINGTSLESEISNLQRDSYVPGTQSIYVKTWGCSHNNSDSEYMAGQLAAYGYTITDNKEKADLWLLNSCTVKNPAEDHFRNSITEAKSKSKLLVLAGCVPQGQHKSDYMQGLSTIGVQQIDRVVEVVEETFKGNSVRFLGQKKSKGKKTGGAALNLPKIRKNPLIEIIAINTGCLNQCTYCKTKHARGELGSYSPEEIVERAQQSFSEGVVELWLTSEDLGAYGIDIGVTLPELLWKLVEVIPEGAMMRLGMTNPPYILEHLEEMAKILRHPRVYSFLHVPVQSASDSVLMDMKREYCIEDFKHVVTFLRNRVPGVNIATDLICGFPTETEEDFAKTMELVKEFKFASLFINQFFPRPGTPAYKMQKIPAQEVKKRTKAVSELFQSYSPYTNQMGQIQDVLVTETSHDQQYYVGHNKSYDQVLVPKQDELMGKLVRVQIVETGKHYLKGQLTDHHLPTRPKVPQPLLKGQVSGASRTEGQSKVSEATTKELTCKEWQWQVPWFWLGVSTLGAALLVRVVHRLSR